MRYGQGQTARGRRRTRRSLSPIPAVLAITLASLLLSGCAGFLSSSQTKSDREGLASSSAPISTTTTTTLSLHERIQQEQTEGALNAVATSSTADPAPQDSSTTNASTTSTTLVPVFVLTDGSTMSQEEFEAIQSYVDEIAPLAEQQYELTAALDPELSLHLPDITIQDVERYRQAVQQQEALWNGLAGVQVPTFMVESHQLRILAASQLYEAATTVLGEIEQADLYFEGSDLMVASLSQFQVGLDTLADAEFGLQIWQQLSEGAYLQ